MEQARCSLISGNVSAVGELWLSSAGGQLYQGYETWEKLAEGVYESKTTTSPSVVFRDAAGSAGYHEWLVNQFLYDSRLTETIFGPAQPKILSGPLERLRKFRNVYKHQSARGGYTFSRTELEERYDDLLTVAYALKASI